MNNNPFPPAVRAQIRNFDPGKSLRNGIVIVLMAAMTFLQITVANAEECKGTVKSYTGKQLIVVSSGEAHTFQISDTTKFLDAEGKANAGLGISDRPWWTNTAFPVTVEYTLADGKSVAKTVTLPIKVMTSGGPVPNDAAGGHHVIVRGSAGGAGMGAPKELIKEGTPLPDIAITSFSGKTIRKSDLLGKVTLLDFWATWCEPCKMASPTMQALYNAYAKQGLNVIGANCMEQPGKNPDKGPAAAKEYAKKERLSYTFASADALKAAVGGQGIPLFVVVDKKGVVRKTVMGFSPDLRADLEKSIKELLKK